ncbi:MAG: nucleotidyltransferase domain-containing protein [Thermodesulfobacteriota bacterium]
MKTIDDIKLKEYEKKAVIEASRLLRDKFPVESVILFGSKARGDDDQESDIDLLLLTTRPIDWKERKSIVEALFDLELAYNVVISIFDIPFSEWQDGIFPMFPIHAEIQEQGALAA